MTAMVPANIKLAVLGESPRFFSLDEAPTIDSLLSLASVAAHMDVRLNGVSIARADYGRVPLKEGDLVVAVPNIEGGR